MHASVPFTPPRGPQKEYSAVSCQSTNKRPCTEDCHASAIRGSALVAAHVRCYNACNLWPTGNKSPRAFAAPAPARNLSHSFPTSLKRRATPWWPSNSRNSWNQPGRMPTLPSGIRLRQNVSVAPIGKPRRKKPPFDSGEKFLLAPHPSKVFQTKLSHLPPPRKPPKCWN